MDLNLSGAAAASLAVAILLLLLMRNDRREYAAFKALTDTAERQRVLRRWVAVSFISFSGVTLAWLAAFGRLSALWVMPPEFKPLAEDFVARLEDSALGAGFVYLMAGVMLASAFIAHTLRSLLRPDSGTAAAGDVEALLPRNGRELVWTTLLSLNAGLSEELFFRLLIPLLLVHVTGSPLAAFAAATALFGLVHLYQGWAGVIATTCLGIVLAAVYLVSGSIWLAVLAHALLDLNALTFQPLLRFAALRRRAGRAKPGG